MLTAETVTDCPRFSIEPVQPAKERIAIKEKRKATFRVIML
jgi:hypothetical protein